VTAKEAFCFKLFEGYLLAMIMPFYLLLVASGSLTSRGASYGLVLIAAMLVVFTLRKVFMPIAYDIDKSAIAKTKEVSRRNRILNKEILPRI
jgi:uncharacterized integral membrane protein